MSTASIRAAIADQLLDRQAVDGEAGQRADDRAGGLEPQREDADQEVARGGELGRARPASSRIRVELGEHVDDRGDGHLGVDRGPGGERPGAAAQVEPGAGAVRVALLLAQLHVQPRVEQPAEDRAHHRDGVEVGDPARQPAVADADLGLDRARPVDDPDDPAGRRARCRRSRPGAIGAPAPAQRRRTGARRRPTTSWPPRSPPTTSVARAGSRPRAYAARRIVRRRAARRSRACPPDGR